MKIYSLQKTVCKFTPKNFYEIDLRPCPQILEKAEEFLKGETLLSI
jgi:hypothetical protein